MTAQPTERRRDAERTRAEILTVATAEFAERGYDGARVDEIAARTSTTKRMIYYYFGGKKQLYVAALEAAYTRIREAEQRVHVDHLAPADAIRRIAEVTFDHHEANPDFIRLVSIENIHRGEHIARLPELVAINGPAVRLLDRILARGRSAGEFRDDVDAVDVHLMISSFCFFRVANQHTFGTLFDRDLLDPARRDHYRGMLSDMVVAHLTSTSR
ncbi:TetR/AcrR family transcriptional regulator [Paractinoplanes rishiriensis]|uniref:TetR family transcriptional regulator n=1 Tax=Paractinoplanes rishiriensis TaxID=1050105 RepID=A0A919K2Z5_9ACTN|nr:TetR/AcrR family transcriptional regulator [Actinoplanes rishiriensis]GIE99268.1 TetR family transcriptional regulator [Actinoplanes rishiriensis]